MTDANLDTQTFPADLTLPMNDGKSFCFADYRGRWLVLYFYPRDNTPGCTKESIGFGEQHAAFQTAGAEILGVSRDSVASHERFRQKYSFPFDLIADTEETLCQLFAVIKEKNMYGRKLMGVERSTFLINPEGQVVASWRKVKVPGHVAAVLHSLQEQQG